MITLKLSLVIQTSIIVLLSITLVQHYAMPGTSLIIRALVSLSFSLGFCGIALLPIDLSVTHSTTREDLEEIMDVNPTYVPWRVTYWSTFLLAWSVLPLSRQFLMDGHFTPLSRLKHAAVKTVKIYILMLALSVIAMIWLAISYHTFDVIPVLMAGGNTYGLLLVSLLLGYGLIDLPRKMWRRSCPELELRRARIMAGSADQALFDAVWELQDCEDAIDVAVEKIQSCDEMDESELISCTDPSAISCQACIDQLIELRNSTSILDRELQSRRTNHRINHGKKMETAQIPKIDDLARLNKRLKQAQASLISADQRWRDLINKSEFYSELMNASPPELVQLDSSSALSQIRTQGVSIHQWMLYLFRTKLRSSCYRLLSLIMVALSALVLWSETMMAWPFNLSPFSLFLGWFDGHDGKGRGIMFKVTALIPLLYMSACVYGSLFKINIFGPYCLRGHNQSPGVALLFNAQYLIRMQFPLAYNYLLMIKYDMSSTNCAFSGVMNNMSTVPFFGTSFSFYAPLLILALCGFTFFDGYARILALLGIEHEDVILKGDPEELDGQVNEGIVLLERRKNRFSSLAKNDSSDSLGSSGKKNKIGHLV